MSAAVPAKRVGDFVAFIKQRERHRLAKQGLKPSGFKPDPIISTFRFCNVRRNDDRVTKWIHENYLARWRGHPELWFALLVARLFNNEPTLDDIVDYVLPFDPTKMRKALKIRTGAELKNFNPAYIVSTNGVAMNKVDYLIDRILTSAYKKRKHVSGLISQFGTLDDVHRLLMGLDGLKSFMAAQIVADLKYAYPPLWNDFHTFAASGPGSKRGLNRLLGLDKDAPMPEATFRATLGQLRDSVNARLTGWEPITAQDIQNCLCEYDKYSRVAEGDKPKQLYKPKEK